MVYVAYVTEVIYGTYESYAIVNFHFQINFNY